MWENESTNDHCVTSSCASHGGMTGRTIPSYWSKDRITAYMFEVLRRWRNKTDSEIRHG